MVSTLYGVALAKLMIRRGESGVGKWTIVIRDTQVNDHKGTFVDWHLKLWGESIDASKTKLLPMPTDEDDASHDVTTTATPTAITTSLPLPSDATQTAITTSVPDDHPDRPVKPSKTSSDSKPSATSTQSAAAETTTESSWLPSFLPTFGVSSRTVAWIYGALGLIVTFCVGLGAWLWWVRRKRIRNNPRDTYDFEPLNADETVGLDGSREKGTKRRGGELYDAFAGGSDDEEFNDRDHSSLVSGDSDDESDRDSPSEQQGSKLLGNRP